MSVPPKIQINISHASNSESAEWFTKTQHDKASNQTTIFLFQRAESKPSLGRSISDFFNGIRPASDKANKHLHHVLSHLPRDENSQSADQATIHIQRLQKIAKHLDLPDKNLPQLGFNIHSGIQTVELQLDVRSESQGKLETKKRWASILNNIYNPPKLPTSPKNPDKEKVSVSPKNPPDQEGASVLPKNLPDKEKVISAINYAIDIESKTARPKSKADIRALSEHLDRLLLLVKFEEDGPLLKQLQTMYTTLENHSK